MSKRKKNRKGRVQKVDKNFRQNYFNVINTISNQLKQQKTIICGSREATENCHYPECDSTAKK